MSHKNLIQIPFKSASEAICIAMCTVCLPSNFRPAALRVIVQNWNCLEKFLEIWNCVPVRSNFDAKLYPERSSDLFWAFRWSNVLFDDEYPLLGAVQNRTKTNDKQMAWVLQCVSKVSSNYNHLLRRKFSLNTTLYVDLPSAYRCRPMCHFWDRVFLSSMKLIILWRWPSSGMLRRLVCKCWLTYQRRSLPPSSGRSHLWNVGQFVPDYTAQHSKDRHLYSRRREYLKSHLIISCCQLLLHLQSASCVFILWCASKCYSQWCRKRS
jgi:hypothetical protein